jgi:NADH-ubiquinone oxidoreductase chain 5
MEPLIVLLPLVGSFLALLLGGRLGSSNTIRLTTSLVALALALALGCFGAVALDHRLVSLSLFPWWDLSLLRLSWGVFLDSLTALMLLVVLSISLLVHIYSAGYMAEDPHRPRFFGYLSLFTFFMLVLVTAPNLPQLFVGWEGVGVCSYLLISFWFTRRQAAKSALKAMVVNRVGDVGLIAAMALLYRELGTLDLATIFALAPSLATATVSFFGWTLPLATTVGLLLLLAAVGKSAQLGLHSWLPDAMEGPTPVSALIHAATMVTAGIFLLMRCSPLLELSPFALGATALVGSLTALFGATTGLFQNDLKRVVAYSTCSQLGYMAFACGLSAYNVGAFHLYNHAFFKALLFLGSGAIIHACADEQDMRRLGGLGRLLPFSYSAMLVGSLSLGGFPFLTGFYSKDLILEAALASAAPLAPFAYGLGALSAFFTAFYSFRLLHFTFLSPPRGPSSTFSGAGGHEAAGPMLLALLPLAVASIFLGFLCRELLVGAGTPFWGGSITLLPGHLSQDWSEFLPLSSKLLPLGLSLGGAGFALLLHQLLYGLLLRFQLGSLGRTVFVLLNGRWLLDPIQNRLLSLPALRFGYRVAFQSLDRGAIELLGPTGLSRLATAVSRRVSGLQSGFLYHYAFLLVAALVLLASLLVLGPGLPLRWGSVLLVLALLSPRPHGLFPVQLPPSQPFEPP